MSLPTDSELVRAYREGDEHALEILISRHTDAIFAYTARLTGERESAADITQETFFKAWRHIGRFREQENFKTWIFTIARNSAFDWLRKKKQVPFSALEGEEGMPFDATIADDEPLPDALAERARDGRFLEVLLEGVAASVRDILLLHYAEGMTFEEIAQIRNASVNTVKSQHRRALLALREKAVHLAPKKG